jgi:hypothetical protein
MEAAIASGAQDLHAESAVSGPGFGCPFDGLVLLMFDEAPLHASLSAIAQKQGHEGEPLHLPFESQRAIAAALIAQASEAHTAPRPAREPRRSLWQRWRDWFAAPFPALAEPALIPLEATPE